MFWTEASKYPTGPFLAAGRDLAQTVRRLRGSMVESGRCAGKVSAKTRVFISTLWGLSYAITLMRLLPP